jgi:hypothetical protein
VKQTGENPVVNKIARQPNVRLHDRDARVQTEVWITERSVIGRIDPQDSRAATVLERARGVIGWVADAARRMSARDWQKPCRAATRRKSGRAGEILAVNRDARRTANSFFKRRSRNLQRMMTSLVRVHEAAR